MEQIANTEPDQLYPEMNIFGAVNENRIDVVKLRLVEDPTRVYERDGKPEMRTPLHHAVILGYLEMAQLLIDKDADVNEVDVYGYTPLHLACKMGNLKLVRYLAANDAQLETRDQYKFNTPLHWAALAGFTMIVQFLLDQGVAVNPVGEDSNTPLHMSALGGNEITCCSLVQNGANPDWLNDQRSTALSLSMHHYNSTYNVLSCLEKDPKIRMKTAQCWENLSILAMEFLFDNSPID